MSTYIGVLRIEKGYVSRLNNTILARLNDHDPLVAAISFLEGLGLNDGDLIRVIGTHGAYETIPVFDVHNAEIILKNTSGPITPDPIMLRGGGEFSSLPGAPTIDDDSPPAPHNAPVSRTSTLASNKPDTYRYAVWYATNRQPSQVGRAVFCNRPEQGGKVHYGKCLVDIPKSHLFGSLGTSWWKRWVKLRFEDDHLKLATVEKCRDAAEFLKSMSSELGGLAESDRHILVYLHGYNVTFEQAALRAAQMGFDLKIRGITAFFSWPSFGTVRSYLADADRIAASESAIALFLVHLAQTTCATDVHVIAHSMGNRGLARAMQRIFAKASRQCGVRFGHIILAAPDIEVSLFRELAAIYPTHSKRTTMYVSGRDKALGMSKWLQQSDRAGFTPPITIVPGIDTIEVTEIDLTILGHGYYAEADGVLRDMFDLINFNAPPDKRARTRAAAGGEPYWIIAP